MGNRILVGMDGKAQASGMTVSGPNHGGGFSLILFRSSARKLCSIAHSPDVCDGTTGQGRPSTRGTRTPGQWVKTRNLILLFCTQLTRNRGVRVEHRNLQARLS